MTLSTFKHWYRYHHQGRPITIVKRYNNLQGIVAIPVLPTGSPREGFLEPLTVTSIPTPEGGIGEIKTDNFFDGTENLTIYIYCGMSLSQAIQYQQEPPATPLHQGVKGRSPTLPTTWMAAAKWLADKNIEYTKKHKANLDPLTLNMKGVIHNYYQLAIKQPLIKEEELVNVPHRYDEEYGAYIILIKTYGYVKKSSTLIRLLNKALISRDKGSCIDYATAFLERPVYSIDMTKIDWSKPVQGIDIIRACKLTASGTGTSGTGTSGTDTSGTGTSGTGTEVKEDNNGEDMGVSLPASYDF